MQSIRRTTVPIHRGLGTHLPILVLWGIIFVCCAMPVLWMLVQLATNPTTLSELQFDAFRLRLLARTILCNIVVAMIAVALALPASVVLGRGRGVLASLLWFILPVSLLLPSLAFAYGWSQFFQLVKRPPEPAGAADVLRCIGSLATWLWPIPAMAMGLALRRSDAQLQQQALLDGVLWRMTLRQLAGPAIASAAVVMIIAVQEFAVFEPTGISVVATEVRMVFETGAYSSPQNPITQQIGFGGFEGFSSGLPDQQARSAAAVAVSLPLLVVVGGLVLIAAAGARRLTHSEHIEAGAWPRVLDAPVWMVPLAGLTVVLTTVVPLVSMILALRRPFHLDRVWAEFGPQAAGSLLIALVTGCAAFMLALLAIIARPRGAIAVAALSFLIGGQLIAIALIRLYNRPWLDWIYNGLPVVTIAYLARFGWIALVAAAMTWSSGAWRGLRDLAAVDGASPAQAAARVVLPLAWPVLAAGAALVMILSLSEVPATVLLSPQRPQVLVPMLMTWVHVQRSDVMIEASLLLCIMVATLGVIAVGLIRLGLTLAPERGIGLRRSAGGGAIAAAYLLIAVLTGCADRAQPEAIWFETGTGAGQTVYPRAITYSDADDTFYLVDRQARIQRFDRRGRVLAEWQTPQSLQGKPVGLSVGPDGNLWVPDTHYYRVLVYSPDGSLLKQFGSKGTGPGQFIYTTDIAFGPDGRVFVSEYGDNDRIQVFDMEGNYLYEFGRFGQGEGEFSRPQSILIADDLVYVADSCNHRICVFTLEGRFLRQFGRTGSALGEFRFPYGLDMDSAGKLIVCEFGNNRVQRVDPETGEGLMVWGGPGRAPGQLAYPWGVAVDRRNRIVTVDAGNNRLQVFQF